MARPTVVFPQPDSPTRPSVSPRSSVNETPSTARTSAVLPRNDAAEDGEADVQVLHVENGVAHVSACALSRRIEWQRTQWPGATSMSGGSMSGHGSKRSGQRVTNLQPTGRSMDVRHRRRESSVRRSAFAPSTRGSDAEQPLRVRVQRIVEQLANRRDLLDLAAVHHGDAVARLGDDREVVRDQQDGRAASRRSFISSIRSRICA